MNHRDPRSAEGNSFEPRSGTYGRRIRADEWSHNNNEGAKAQRKGRKTATAEVSDSESVDKLNEDRLVLGKHFHSSAVSVLCSDSSISKFEQK